VHVLRPQRGHRPQKRQYASAMAALAIKKCIYDSKFGRTDDKGILLGWNETIIYLLLRMTVMTGWIWEVLSHRRQWELDAEPKSESETKSERNPTATITTSAMTSTSTSTPAAALLPPVATSPHTATPPRLRLVARPPLAAPIPVIVASRITWLTKLASSPSSMSLFQLLQRLRQRPRQILP